MAKIFIGNTGYKLFLGNTKIKRAYLGNTLVYSGDITVTYHIDMSVGLDYAETVEEGDTCLSPKSFNPQSLKPGFTFLGWRMNPTPDSQVIETLIAGSDNIDLYAVYYKDYIVNFYNASTTKIEKAFRMYYNNGNIKNPIATSEDTTLTEVAAFKNALGWTTDLNSTVQKYANKSNIEIKSDMNLYSVYSQNITVFIYNGSTSGPVKSTFTGTRYRQYNSSAVYTKNPSTTLTHNDYPGWTNAGWGITAGSSAKSFDDGLVNFVDTYDGKSIYAMYSKDTTMYLMNGSNAGGIKSTVYGKRYTQFTTTTQIIDPVVNLSHTALSGWNVNGWNLGADNSTPLVSDGNVSLPETYDNKTLYALYRANITVTWYGSNTSTVAESKYRCIRAIENSWAVTNPSFNRTIGAMSGWTIVGWATDINATTATYASGASFNRSTDVSLFALYKQGITVSWYNNVTTPSNETKNRFVRPNTNKTWYFTNPSFARAVSAVSGMDILGWTTSQTYVTSATYASGVAFTRDSSVSLFAAYRRTVNVVTRAKGAVTSNQTKYYYYNRGKGSSASTFTPTFTASNPANVSGKTFIGWSTSASSTTVVTTSINNRAVATSTTFYAVWRNADAVIFNNPEGQYYEINWTPYHWRSEHFDIVTISYATYKSIDMVVSGDLSVGKWAVGNWCFFRLFPGTVPYEEDPYHSQPWNFELRAINQQNDTIRTDRGPCAEQEVATVTNIPLYQTSGNNSKICVAFQDDYYSAHCRIYKIIAHGRDVIW